MDLRRLRVGEWVAAASGVALLVSLFLPWYEPTTSGWESLAAIDVLLALVAASGVLLAIVTAVQRVPASRSRPPRWWRSAARSASCWCCSA